MVGQQNLYFDPHLLSNRSSPLVGHHFASLKLRNSTLTRGVGKSLSIAIFIHWGTYSVPTYAPVIPGKLAYAEWYWNAMINGRNNPNPRATPLTLKRSVQHRWQSDL